jgi:hypothetical protein
MGNVSTAIKMIPRIVREVIRLYFEPVLKWYKKIHF